MDRVVASRAPAFSWGAALFPDDGTDIDRILEVADAQLRRRKAEVHGG